MPKPKHTVHSTLGELIVAITDEVAPLADNPRQTYALVSCVLQDLLLQRRIRVKNRAVRVTG